MAVTMEQIHALHDMTQADVIDCGRALREANGDMEIAKKSS